jgi:hypothetical protein
MEVTWYIMCFIAFFLFALFIMFKANEKITAFAAKRGESQKKALGYMIAVSIIALVLFILIVYYL